MGGHTTSSPIIESPSKRLADTFRQMVREEEKLARVFLGDPRAAKLIAQSRELIDRSLALLRMSRPG